MSQEPSSHEEKFTKILRELTWIKYLLAFIAVCVGIMLFIPRLAASIGSVSISIQESLSPYVSEIVGVLFILIVVTLGAAYIMSRLSPTLDYNPENGKTTAEKTGWKNLP